MIIPLMAVELFGLRVMGRLMGIVLTADGVAEAVVPMMVADPARPDGQLQPGLPLARGPGRAWARLAVAFLPKPPPRRLRSTSPATPDHPRATARGPDAERGYGRVIGSAAMGRDDDAFPLLLASRAGADRLPRRGALAPRPRAPRRRGLGGLPRLPLPTRRCAGRWGPTPIPSCAGASSRAAAPAPAPAGPRPSAEVLAEFRRIAPLQYNAQHPRSFSYFTPPPLLMSIVGELLCQWINQGVDIWHAGPSAALVEEEVVGWLTDLVGYGPGSFGVLTSGGVMANVMALTLARDVHLRGAAWAGPRPAARPRPRGRARLRLGPGPLLDRPRPRLPGLPGGDAAHRALRRALPPAGGAGGRGRSREDRAAGLVPLAIAAVAGSTNTGSVDRIDELADVAEREGLWLHVDAAYGGAAPLSARDWPPACPPWTAPTPSPSTRTSGCSRPTTSAACW